MKFKKYKVTFVDVLQAKNYEDAYDQLRRSFLGAVDENGWMHDVDVFEFKEYRGTKWIGADRYDTKRIIDMLHRENRPIPDELFLDPTTNYTQPLEEEE